MNPETNKFEKLTSVRTKEPDELTCPTNDQIGLTGLLLPNGEPVPKTWTTFRMGEEVVIKDYTFRVAYIGETSILFEPVGLVKIGENNKCSG